MVKDVIDFLIAEHETKVYSGPHYAFYMRGILPAIQTGA